MRISLFSVSAVFVALWTPDDDAGPRSLIVLGHGGGRHKQDPELLPLVGALVAEGFAVVCADVGSGPVGYWGISTRIRCHGRRQARTAPIWT